MFGIEYRRPARKALTRMPKPLASRFLSAFEQLAQDPSRSDLDTRRLVGRDGYRLRTGEWRAIYRIEADRLVIMVLDIGPRGDIYK
ncbi:type II toxin-antitoxin system RelE family toxin [Candidatus Thiosymbion oneisti]|uniref:type II toxin-antitoxin system RelE family toxin n=1 Tax=Candidatus Thiosymbion oneisti TaxID=589554 RepID=UPI000B7D8E76|nr:type II toxin-antitoxin system RelE/ParE family toxin [Candidatus Thiosymbion oneisti]